MNRSNGGAPAAEQALHLTSAPWSVAAAPPLVWVRSQESGGVGQRIDIAALGSWDECLLWITGWGVWPPTEDWPRYYAARGALGERRSLETALAQLFVPVPVVWRVSPISLEYPAC